MTTVYSELSEWNEKHETSLINSVEYGEHLYHQNNWLSLPVFGFLASKQILCYFCYIQYWLILPKNEGDRDKKKFQLCLSCFNPIKSKNCFKNKCSWLCLKWRFVEKKWRSRRSIRARNSRNKKHRTSKYRNRDWSIRRPRQCVRYIMEQENIELRRQLT